jgi:hypothetical protein
LKEQTKLERICKTLRKFGESLDGAQGSIAYGRQRGSTAPAKAEKLQILAPKTLKRLNRLIVLHGGCAHDVTRGEGSPESRFSPVSALSRGGSHDPFRVMAGPVPRRDRARRLQNFDVSSGGG